MKRTLLTSLLSATVLASAGSIHAEPLRIWISSFQDKVYYEDMVKLYREAGHNDFEAEVVAYGFREMPDKLAVAIKTGVNPPDIVQLDEVLFGMYLGGEVPFVDLTDRVKAAGLEKDIVPQRMALFSSKGRYYGLPQSLSAMLMYYRTDIFDKYNIKPEDISTWDDFVYVGEGLAKKGHAMLALDPSYFEILLRQRGSDWFGADGKLFPDRKKAADTLRFLSSLQEKGIAILPDRASIFDPVFFSGDVASETVFCVIGADWYGLDMIQQFSPEFKGRWGIMPLPAWNDGGKDARRTSTFAGQGLMIYKGTKQVDPAWNFIQFVMTNREANVRRFTGGNSFPAYKPVWDDDRLLAPNAFFNDQAMGKMLISLAPQLPYVAMNPKRPMAVFMFQENFFPAFMMGQMSAGDLMTRMEEAMAHAGGPPGAGDPKPDAGGASGKNPGDPKAAPRK